MKKWMKRGTAVVFPLTYLTTRLHTAALIQCKSVINLKTFGFFIKFLFYFREMKLEKEVKNRTPCTLV